MKLTISRKLLLGYLFMALLTVLAGAYALFSLQRIHQVAHDITQHNFAVIEQSKKLTDALLAQESAEKRYLILKDPLLEQIFLQRSREFEETLGHIRSLSLDRTTQRTFDEIQKFHQQLHDTFIEEVALVQNDQMPEAQALSESIAGDAIDEIAKRLRTVQIQTDRSITEKMNQMTRRGRGAVNITLALALLSLLLGVTLALLITRNISKPLQQLQKAAGMIAEGNLDHHIEARRDDEIGALAKSFAEMTKRLKILEELNLDASPLTGLPGNLAIENRIKSLLGKKKKFSLCQVDLDNFKPFGDKYGYAWGSEVIKEVANMLKGYITETQATDIFIGHIGGDDYVIVGNPEGVETICQRLVKDFEEGIRKYYTEEDARNGYYIGRDRQGVLQKFPLITLTAAIVTDDGTRFADPLEMGRIAADLKEYAKTLPGSNYVTELDVEKHKKRNPPIEQRRLDLEYSK